MLGTDQILTGMNGENDVNIDLCVGIGHASGMWISVVGGQCLLGQKGRVRMPSLRDFGTKKSGVGFYSITISSLRDSGTRPSIRSGPSRLHDFCLSAFKLLAFGKVKDRSSDTSAKPKLSTALLPAGSTAIGVSTIFAAVAFRPPMTFCQILLPAFLRF